MPRSLAALTLAAACVLSAEGRQSAVAQPQTFRSGTRLVQVSVVVLNRDKEPVSGLTAADFEVLEDGRPQPIELFSVESVRGRDPGEAAAVVPPGTFTNRAAGRADGSLTAILLDRLNTRWQDQVQARAELLKFLGQIRAEDRVALYALDGDAIRVLHDFAADAASLVRAVERAARMTSRELEMAEGTAPEAGDPGDADLDAFLRGSTDKAAEAAAGGAAFTTISALQSVAAHLAGVRGRKNLVWVSSGFPLNALLLYGQSRTREIQRATRALNDAQVSLYSVDARGLIGAFGNDGRRTTLSTVYTNLDIMTITADETGGRAFFNRNDLGNAIRLAIDDSRVTYLLGYYPARGEPDGRFRQIKVRVKRPGVEVRHRKGYFATAPGAAGPDARTDALRDALRNPLEATGLGLTAQAIRVGNGCTIAVTVDASSLVLQDNLGKWTGGVDLLIAQFRGDGTSASDIDTTIAITATAGERERMLKNGLGLSQSIAIKDDTRRITIVVRDISTGATGSLIIPVDALIDTGAGKGVLVRTYEKR